MGAIIQPPASALYECDSRLSWGAAFSAGTDTQQIAAATNTGGIFIGAGFIYFRDANGLSIVPFGPLLIPAGVKLATYQYNGPSLALYQNTLSSGNYIMEAGALWGGAASSCGLQLRYKLL